MAAVEHPTASAMNGDIQFTIGTEENTDDAYASETLEEEVRRLTLTINPMARVAFAKILTQLYSLFILTFLTVNWSTVFFIILDRLTDERWF